MSQFAEDFPVGSKVTRNNVPYAARFIEDGVTYIVLGKGTKGTYLGGECIDLAHLDGAKVSPFPAGFACKAFDLVDGE
jgi:hypothetical protein